MVRSIRLKDGNFVFLRRGFFVPAVLVFVLCMFAFVQRDAFATEGGGGAYPNGAEGFMAGAVPPPGTYFLDYFTYYSADKFRIKDAGDLPVFDLNVTANTFRLLHVTKQQVLGGFWGMHVFVPVVNIDVDVPGASGSKFGVGDIIVDPFILSWHSKNWHFVTAVDIYIPTGVYDKDRVANIGRNYWTFEPIAGFTYVSDGGFEVSGKFMYDFNTKNSDTKYTSGQEFHFDYLIGYQLKPWSIGLNGYYYKQTTGDEFNGTEVPDGFKGQVLALGPALKYDHKNMSFMAKYQKEMSVENKPEGDKFWLKFVYTF